MRAYDIQRIRNIEIAIPEYFIYFFRLQFTMSCIRYILDGIAKVFTHLWRQRNTILLLENIANSTFAALAVDTNDIRVIGTADVMRVNDDIRYRPPVFIPLLTIGHAFGNGILMASGEGRKDQFSSIRASLINFHTGDSLIYFRNCRHIGEIQLWINPMAVHIHCQCDCVNISGAFTIAEQTAFNAICTSQQAKFRICNPCTAVIVRMKGQNDRVTVFEILMHVFDLRGINMRHRHLYGGRQIDNHRFVRCRLHDIQYGIADFQRIFRFCSGKALR